MSEIMKIVDERETNKKTKQNKKNKDQRTREDRTYSERVIGKGFCCVFKLGFFQLRCKASLIFKSNLS